MSYSYDMKGEGSGFQLEEGSYEFLVNSFVDKLSKQGNQMHVASLEEVKSGQIDDVYLVAEKGKRWFLKQFLAACGILADAEGKYNFDTPDVLGKIVVGKIKNSDETFIDRQGVEQHKTKSKIVQFSPVEIPEGAKAENPPF